MAFDRLIPLFEELQYSLDAFLLDVQARGLRPATVKYYRRETGAFLSFAAGDGAQSLTDITPDTIRRYLAALQGRGLSGASVHTAARAVRAFCNFAVSEELIETSPMARVKMPAQDSPNPDSFTENEIRKLLAAAESVRDKAIILCLLDTGCRAGEFCAWDRGDIDLPAGAVVVHSAKTKGRKTRVVYLGARARKAMLKHLRSVDAAPDAPVWVSKTRGRRLNVNGLQQLLQRIGRKAKVVGVSPHKFRRTFAITCLRNGMNVYALARLMGHSSIETLRFYLGLVESDLADAHKRAGPVDRI